MKIVGHPHWNACAGAPGSELVRHVHKGLIQHVLSELYGHSLRGEVHGHACSTLRVFAETLPFWEHASFHNHSLRLEEPGQGKALPKTEA